MEDNVCGQCGKEIEGEGLAFRGLLFCGDECCDKYEALAVDSSEPDELALAESDEEDDLDTDLGYREDEPDGDLLDDDFAIDPEDF